MMMLCIGGIADGEWHDGILSDLYLSTHGEKYYRGLKVLNHADGDRFLESVWIVDGMTEAQALIRLTQYYRGQSHYD